MITTNEIRKNWLEFFAKNGHTVVSSSPLVPHNDPTLMFTNAGMVQFKNIFTGQEKRDYIRATTAQKCVRAGGKHNDLDNVGYTCRHHTFFEMMGNFSFGDDFKAQAIEFAWDMVTKELGINKDKLCMTVFAEDDEAWNLCTKYVCGQAGVDNLSDVGFGRLYAEASKEFAQPFRDLAYNGYGLIFTSHSAEKEFKNEKGEKYTQIVPALQNRAFDIINKMVDIIAYIREISLEDGDKVIRKRFMFLRDEVGDRFLVKSRYRYIAPRIPLDYNALVEAIYKAIDDECANSGGAATDEHNPYTTLNFDELMEEAKMLWGQVVQNNKTAEASAILESVFGKPKKFSEILPEEVDGLNQVLIEVRAIL